MNDMKNMENFEENNINLVSAFGKTMCECFSDASANMVEYVVSEKGKKYAKILSRIDFLGIGKEK